MKPSVVMTTLVVMLLAAFLWTVEAWGRAGGGGSSGSRGSRSYSAPVQPSPSPSRPVAPPSSVQQSPQRSGWMGGFMGGIGGLFLGGLIGSMLFGGMGSGLGGGIGLMEILIVGGLAYFALSYVRRRQRKPAGPQGHATPQAANPTPWQPGAQYPTTATLEVAAAPSDLERGVAHIRQMDGAFDVVRFADTASDAFFKVQAAWMARDMGSVQDRLTPEMHATLQKECDQLRAKRHVNRLENIAVRSVEVTEAWQEGGQDFVTVRFLANLLDYTVDETSAQVTEGSRTEPVKFEEYWTFVRPDGPNTWSVSAIQQ